MQAFMLVDLAPKLCKSRDQAGGWYATEERNVLQNFLISSSNHYMIETVIPQMLAPESRPPHLCPIANYKQRKV